MTAFAVRHFNDLSTTLLEDGYPRDNLGDIWRRIEASAAEQLKNQQTRQTMVSPKPEKLPGFTPGRFDAFYRQVVADGEMGFGAHEDELDPDEVKGWIKRHRELFKKGEITVWRTMSLTQEQIADLKPGAELGNHWTFGWDDSVIEGFDIQLTNTTREIVVFEAKVRTGDIAFPLTVAYNCYFPHENEVFLHGRFAKPLLVGLRRFDRGTWSLDNDQLRPDLIGKTLRA